MKILTLRIAKQAGDQLSFIPLSIDPSERINHPNFNKQLNTPLDEIRRTAREKLSKSLEHASEVALVSTGEYLKRELWPDELSEELAKTSASMVYLDLEEDLIDIPWECVRIDGEAWLGSRFVVGRHVRIASGKEPSADELNKKFVIISDPDGTLPAAQAEGASLVKALGNDQSVTLLNTEVSKGEAAEYIRQCRVFHYAGHSSEHGLHFSDGILTPADIFELGLKPRLAFLNSCESGHTSPANSRVGPSIVQALLANGTLGVICTNGLVNSATSAAIADRFYARFLSGEALGPSFAAAVKTSEYPIDWARYTIYGNPLFDLKKPVKPRIPLSTVIGALIFLTILTVGILGYWLYQKHAIPTSYTAEERIQSIACDAGSLSACFSLAEALQNREQVAESTNVYQNACKRGHRQSCARVAVSLLNSGDYVEALKAGEYACGSNGTYCYEFVFALVDRGLADDARRIANDLCEKDQGFGCSILAQLHDMDNNAEKSMEFHAKACQLNYTLSCSRHALMSVLRRKDQSKLDVLKSYCESKDILGACADYGTALVSVGQIDDALKAFDADCSEATQFNVIACEIAGSEILRYRPEKGRTYLKAACDYGRASACSKLTAETNTGTDNPCGKLKFAECREYAYKQQKQNQLAEALRIYDYLCGNAMHVACNDAGVVALQQQDLAKAEQSFRVACAQKEQYSCENLADVLAKMGDNGSAIKTATEACERGIGGACFKAYILIDKTKASELALTYLEKGCTLGHPASCNDFAFAKAKDFDKSTSIKAYTRACTDGFLRACSNLGILYSEIGKLDEALKWYRHACDAGDNNACDLKELTEISSLRKTKAYAEASSRMSKFCSDERTDGCKDLGDIALDMGDKDRGGQAYLKSCHAADHEGCAKYGALQLQERRAEIALEFCSKACKAGTESGCACARKAELVLKK